MKVYLYALFLLLCTVSCWAHDNYDEKDSPTATNFHASHVDSNSVGQLRAEIDALAFFRNNEYSSRVMKGYTLPGAWLEPKLTYTPLRQIQLEAGAHLLFFDGANRYPCYAYHDIALWKGEQYQHGVHALPFFRAQANLKHLSIILGDIYGATAHQLILPLFNPEQQFSADPEMGFQILLNRKHVHHDTWINWQSYIFNLDSHQEAFTVGLNSTILWNRDMDKNIQWETPIQFIIQHRGGEQDTTSLGVQTVCNGSIGLRMNYFPNNNKTFQKLRTEVNMLGSWQQHGTLWPFDTGLALHASARATAFNNLEVEVGYVGVPSQYANLYGYPYFGTLSTKFPGTTFRGMHTPYASASYSYTFAHDYTLAADIDIYSAHSRNLSALAFGFGISLHVNPSFLIASGKKRKE